MIAERLTALQAQIETACAEGGRDPSEVRLLAVSKGHPASAIRAAWDCGLRDFGESYVQEWNRKADDPTLQGLEGLRWHFVGHLQRNKVRFLVGRTACIETIDRLRLAHEVSRRAVEHGISQAVLLQVNLESEPTKAGFTPEGLEACFRELNRLTGLRIEGLMSIPRPRATAEQTRPDHAALRRLRDDLSDRYSVALRTLSMGMSSDLEVAIAEGSTRVRVGTAIFGAR